MRIPDGDLVPRRRRSRYGGGYGRRRRTRDAAALTALALLVAGAGYWLVLREEEPVAALQPCPTPTVSPTVTPTLALPSTRQVRLALLNGTPRNGLAHTVAAQLRARGFVVLSEGNAAAALGGASTVSYGPGALGAATVLTRHVHGSRLVSAPRAPADRVVLVLGGDFRRLATPAEVTAKARAASPASAVPSPAPPGCRS